MTQVKIPFDNIGQFYYLRKWWFNYEGRPISDKDTALIKEFLKSWSDTWLPTWREVMARNLLVELPALKCPVYFFIGGRDYQTNCEIAKSYYDKLSAPKNKCIGLTAPATTYWYQTPPRPPAAR